MDYVEYISHALAGAAKEAAVLLYSPEADPFLEDLMRNADRAFFFEEGQRAAPRLIAKSQPKTQKSQPPWRRSDGP